MINYSKAPVGEFQEKDHGAYFTYSLTTDAEAIKCGFTHEVHMSDNSIRFAIVKKTVVLVYTEDDDLGRPILEKWFIKNHTVYVR